MIDKYKNLRTLFGSEEGMGSQILQRGVFTYFLERGRGRGRGRGKEPPFLEVISSYL